MTCIWNDIDIDMYMSSRHCNDIDCLPDDIDIDFSHVYYDVVSLKHDIIIDIEHVQNNVVPTQNDVVIDMSHVHYDIVRAGNDVVATSTRPTEMSITMSSDRETTS